MLAAADDAGDVQLFYLAAAQQLEPLSEAHSSICGSVAFNPVRDWELCTGGMDARCVEWDFRRALRSSEWSLAPPPEQASSQLLNPRYVHCLSYAPDGHVLAVALGDGSVELRQAGSGEVLVATTAHRAAASQAHFAPELADGADAGIGAAGGPLPLVTAGDDAQLRLWTAENLAPPSDDFGGAKRRRSTRQAESAAADEAADEEGTGAGPLLRPGGAIELPEKANWVAAASVGGFGTGARTGAVCVASNAEAILVLVVRGTAFA